MKKIIHPIAGLVAMLTIATFWISSALVEVFGSPEAIATVKQRVVWGLLLLAPSLAVTGGSGVAASRGRRDGLVGVKLRRMRVIAANGLLILAPSALFLAARARAGVLDETFRLVQAVEFAAGALNLVLLGLNMRDGFRMSRRFKRASH